MTEKIDYSKLAFNPNDVLL
jgi:hypothetical protein